jgi:hypothetical protein
MNGFVTQLQASLREPGSWLCQSTGAEIETALCILESVLPRVPTLLVGKP